MKRVLLFCCIYLPSIAYAEVTKSTTGPITSDYMSKLLLSLGLVVAVIFTLAWLVKRFRFLPNQSHNLITVISTLSVGSRDRLALIQVGEEQLLIALTPGKISKLHSLKKPIQGLDKASSFKNKLDAAMDDKQDNVAS